MASFSYNSTLYNSTNYKKLHKQPELNPILGPFAATLGENDPGALLCVALVIELIP